MKLFQRTYLEEENWKTWNIRKNICWHKINDKIAVSKESRTKAGNWDNAQTMLLQIIMKSDVINNIDYVKYVETKA